MRPVKAVLLAMLASVLATGTARADVTPRPIFSDNMVLQQGTELIVWGKADPGEKVTVELSQKTENSEITDTAPVVTAGEDGGWKVRFGKRTAGTVGFLVQHDPKRAGHRRVARQAHKIISGCSGRRANSAQRGTCLKRSGSRAMKRFAGKTAASNAISPRPAK